MYGDLSSFSTTPSLDQFSCSSQKHLREFHVDLLRKIGLGKFVGEFNISCGPSFLNSEVHDHLNSGPGGHRRIYLKVVDAIDMSVASHTKMSLVIPNSSIGKPFDLEGPS